MSPTTAISTETIAVYHQLLGGPSLHAIRSRRATYITCTIAALLITAIFVFELTIGTTLEIIATYLLLVIMVGASFFGLLSVYYASNRYRASLVGLPVSAFAILWVLFSAGFGSQKIIGPVTAADGTEMCVVQSYHGALDYGAAFLYRKPGQPWGWCYLEHEGTRWWLGGISLSKDGKIATVRRFLFPFATFHLENDKLVHARDGRTILGAQKVLCNGWKPGDPA
jgi:hypothetical protein